MLEGLKVVELATYVAAPSATAVMSDWGADVIKIESGRGDPTRRTFAGQPHLEGNPVFEWENHGKRGVVLDTGKPAGREALLRILKDADIFVTNLRPGALKRAKLDYDSLKAELPRLIYVSITGYGLEGPGADLPAFDMAALWSHGGIGGAMTPRGHEPPQCRPGMGDSICALSAVSGALAAVIERSTTGKGRLVEASLIRAGTFAIGWDMAIQLKWSRLATQRTRKEVLDPLSNYFRTSDERWVGIFPRDGRDEFEHIVKVLDLPALASDPRFATARDRAQNVAALVEALDEGFARLTLAEAGRRLTDADMIWGPLNAPRDTVVDPLAEAAGCFVDIVDADGVAYRQPTSPARFPGAPEGPQRPAPKLGQHTREVLAAAGYMRDEIETLIAEGAAT
ncbi:MAG TPA: CaiB/BaiF CoA-transferase family protein [Caulobacteraceae bacterium]|jgi:crotonobetainyl-CoA:carnitine CoA-transferase CaiB-like acyl-CoA transferase